MKATTFIDSTVTDVTTYKYQVRARDAANNFSANSNEVTIQVSGAGDSIAPSAPSNVTGTATTTSVALQWTASTDNVGVEGYEIYRNGAKVGTSTVPSYSDTGLTKETSYKYTVKAFDAAGNLSAASNEVTVETSAGTDTEAPCPSQSYIDRRRQLQQ